MDTDTMITKNIRHALDQSAIIAITDRAGNIIYVNDMFCAISKYSRKELMGENHRIINSGYHSKEFFVEMWETIATGHNWVGEIRNRAKDGSIYWVHTTIVPFLDNAGKPVEYVSIRFEISRRKIIEEQLRTSNEELEHFAYVAAHDLQEPLRKIQAFGDRLLTKYRAALAEEGKDYLDRMQNAAQRMRRLIDDLLTYSRVTSQAKPFQRVNLSNILENVLSDLEIRIEQTKAKIHVSNLPTIDADPSQMQQLFQNMISNSLKFQKEGNVPEISVSARTTPYHCEITFMDNGIGFDEQYVEKMFTIFQRLHGKQEYEGTGLGLAVCKKIIKRHSGNIQVYSTLGAGAKFVITLPLKQKEEDSIHER